MRRKALASILAVAALSITAAPAFALRTSARATAARARTTAARSATRPARRSTRRAASRPTTRSQPAPRFDSGWATWSV